MTLQEQTLVHTLSQVFDAVDVEEHGVDEPCSIRGRWVDAAPEAIDADWRCPHCGVSYDNVMYQGHSRWCPRA